MEINLNAIKGIDVKALYHSFRRNGTPISMPRVRLADVHHTINRRAPYARILREKAVDGKLGMIRSGMDCDCTQYHHEAVVVAPEGAVVFEKRESEHAEWLDGPESTRWVRPDEVEPQYKSADRALEAYEDGRTTILWGSLDD